MNHVIYFRLSQYVSDYRVDTSESDEDEEHSRKQAKISRKLEDIAKPKQIAASIKTYRKKVIPAINGIWKKTTWDKRVDASHVKAEYDKELNNYSIAVRCLICDHAVVLGTTKYAVSTHNYKQHISKKHPSVIAAGINASTQHDSSEACDPSEENSSEEYAGDDPQVAAKIESYCGKAVWAVNRVLSRTCIEKRIDESCIKTKYDPHTKSYYISTRCVLCNQKLALGRTRYSVSACNVSRHLAKVHNSSSIKAFEEHSNDAPNFDFVDVPKVMKLESNDSEDDQIVVKIEDYRSKAVSATNEVLENADIEGRIDETFITVTYDSRKKVYSVYLRCLLCDQKIILNKTTNDVSALNYKIHMSKKHADTDKRKLNDHKTTALALQLRQGRFKRDL